MYRNPPPSSFFERHFLPLYLGGLVVFAVYGYYLIQSVLSW